MNVVLNRTVVVVVDSELSVGTDKTVCYILVSTLSGCPYSGVPLYMIFRTTSVSSLFWVAVIQICYVHVQWLATVTQHGDRGWNRTYVPIDINPSIKKKNQSSGRAVGLDLQFLFLSEKTRMSNHLWMSQQRQHVLVSYFKTLSVGPAWVWTLTQLS